MGRLAGGGGLVADGVTAGTTPDTATTAGPPVPDRTHRRRAHQLLRFVSHLRHQRVQLVVLHVPVLDVAAILPEVDGDPVRTGELGQDGFEAFDVDQRAAGRHVATVEQRMDAHRLDSVGGRSAQHRVQMGLVAVDIAVRQQADQMQGTAGSAARSNRLPALPVENRSGFYGLADQFGTLLSAHLYEKAGPAKAALFSVLGSAGSDDSFEFMQLLFANRPKLIRITDAELSAAIRLAEAEAEAQAALEAS